MAKNIITRRPSGRKTPSRKASGLSKLMAEVKRLDRLFRSDAWQDSLMESELDQRVFPNVMAHR